MIKQRRLQIYCSRLFVIHPTANPSVIVYEKNSNYADGKKDVGEIKVTLDREGYSSNTSLTHYEKTGSNGKVNFSNVKKGFYDIKIEFLSRTDLPDIIDEVVVDDDGDFVFEYETKPQREITYTIKCQPIYGDGTFRTFSNVRNVVGPGPNDIYTPIKFTIYVNGKKYLGEQLINYHKADGYVTVTFTDSSICKSEDEDTPSLLVKQEVECFNKEDCYEYYKAIVSDFTNSVDNFQIRRCEDLGTSGDTHLRSDGWEWKVDTSAKKHYQQCKKCGWTRFKADHYIRMDVNGKTTKNQYDYYANGAYTGDTNNTSTEHYKFCTVCRQYDEKESCTNTSNFTANRNTYVKDSARSDGKVLLKKNTSTISKSNTYHYKYCTVCYQRTVAAEHDKQWEVTKEHAKFDISNHKNDLTGKFDYKDMGKQKFPDGTEKQSHAKFCKTCNYQYGDVKAHNSNTTVVKYADSDGKEYTTKVNSAVKKVTYKYCSGCGHYGGNVPEDLVRECTGKHVWDASCGTVHEKNFAMQWAGSCGSEHCWGCGSSSCSSHNVKYRCITCINCGILNLHGDPNPDTRDDMWCYAHEKGYKTVKYNEALNKKYGKLHNTNSENKY